MRKIISAVPAWVVYVAGFVLLGWQFFHALSGSVGPEPVKWLEHAYGETAMYLLIAGLAITPILKLWRVNFVKYRRALGLMAFAFVTAHFLVWFVLDVQIVSQIWGDILKRPYITVGFAAFLLMIPLAITSNNRSLRKMGPLKWRKLHKLTYLISILAVIHYLMQAKVVTPTHLFWAGVFVLLLGYRLWDQVLKPRMKKPKVNTA